MVNEISAFTGRERVTPSRSLRVAKAFAPILAGNGGGALLDISSILSGPGPGGYGDSKAALCSTTNSLRIELDKQSTLVVAAHRRGGRRTRGPHAFSRRRGLKG